MLPPTEAARSCSGSSRVLGSESVRCGAQDCLFSFFLGGGGGGGEEVESRFGGGGRGDQAEEIRWELYA